jgi:hypothetical protein
MPDLQVCGGDRLERSDQRARGDCYCVQSPALVASSESFSPRYEYAKSKAAFHLR